MYASRTTQFIVGIFGLVGIAALSVLAFTLSRIPLVSKPHYTLYAMFDNVSGLKVSDAIQIAGVRVGKVSSITLSQKNERAQVTLDIREGIMIDEDAIASIKTSGIIGDKYVALAIGGGDPLKDGGTIIHTESSFVLEDAIGQLVNGGGSKSSSGDNSQSSPAASPSPAAGGIISAPPGSGAAKNQEKSDNNGDKANKGNKGKK
jgi:phospholipid/cholesterol/gamma-HCH transport system substrate-binding protein